MKKFLSAIVFVLLAFNLYAQYTGKPIGPEVAVLDGKKLQWEAGSFDSFVMFKSLIGNTNRANCQTASEQQSVGCDWTGNPEGDTCLAQSTFAMNASYLPSDAYVEAAYLVWSSSVEPSKFNQPTDNKATLSYTSLDGKINLNRQVTASRQGVLGNASSIGQQDFTFEGFSVDQSPGNPYYGYYTYRVDVSSFFHEIHEKGREAGVDADGYSLLGNYTVSNVACSVDPRYISNRNGSSSVVIGGWTLITIYRSSRVKPKMVYLYNGFAGYQFQEQDIMVSGFEFPDKPTVKVTLHVLEGDPGISAATHQNCGSGLFGGPCPPEGLSVTGQTTPGTEWVILQNECNPAMFKDQQGNPFNYSETYNSISSVYGWEDTFPTCIGGDPNNPNPDALEYTMDVDTFILDADNDPMFDYHFKKGDDTMFFKVGANGDWIFTNFMVVSVDTKAPRYDIPPNINTPHGREKHFCSCSTEPDAVCFDAPFYFTIKIENWGDDLSTDVKVQDILTPKVSYVAGTTEMCKDWKSPNVCNKWIKIDDKNGRFPLEDPYPVADVMGYCDAMTSECSDTIMIRFKVLPSPTLPKHEVIENTALISDSSGIIYRTNTSIPLRLTSGSCPSPAKCENPDLTECGGSPSEGCTNDDECEDGEVCNSKGQCELDMSKFTKDATIQISKGKNSPANSAAIVVPSPSERLTMGQFSILAKDDSGGDKFFNFNSMTVKVTKDNLVKLSSLKLIYDEPGDGKTNTQKPVVAEVESVTGNTASLALKKGLNVYSANVLHHFLLVSDAEYLSANDVPSNNLFGLSIESATAFDIKDTGAVTIEMSETPIDFVKYSFEPSREAFIFTKGPIDPSVPAISEMNKEVPVLNIRTKAIGHTNRLEKIRLRTTSRSVQFKDGIKRVKVYLDRNGDGGYKEEDLLADVSPKEISGNLEIPFYPVVTFNEDEEKHLVIICDFKIPDNKMAQIEILGGSVTITNKVSILGTPVQSKEYWFRCEDGDLSCQDVKDEKSGCSITVVDSSKSSTIMLLLFVLIGLFYQNKHKKRTAE